jgi:hypothetical protein
VIVLPGQEGVLVVPEEAFFVVGHPVSEHVLNYSREEMVLRGHVVADSGVLENVHVSKGITLGFDAWSVDSNSVNTILLVSDSSVSLNWWGVDSNSVDTILLVSYSGVDSIDSSLLEVFGSGVSLDVRGVDGNSWNGWVWSNVGVLQESSLSTVWRDKKVLGVVEDVSGDCMKSDLLISKLVLKGFSSPSVPPILSLSILDDFTMLGDDFSLLVDPLWSGKGGEHLLGSNPEIELNSSSFGF